MTLTQLRTEIWEALGEPTDIDPSSDATRLNLVVNEAVKKIATWVDPSPRSARRARFRSLTSDLFFRSKTISGTLAPSGTVATSTSIVFSSTYCGNQNDRYNGWVVSVGSNQRLIVDYVGASYAATVQTPWTAPSNGDAYKLYKDFYYLLPSNDTFMSSPSGEHIQLPSTNATINRPTGNFLEVLKIEDLSSGVALGRGHRTESWINNITSPGEPTEWRRDGMKLRFDRPTDDQRWFHIWYYRLPTEMSNDSDEPDIPEMFHYGIVLWGLFWGYRRAQEAGKAYSAEQTFHNFMRSTLNTYEMESEMMESRGTLRPSDYNYHFGGNR